MALLQEIFHALTQVHPLHPMFVHFPIALTGAAAFFILLALWKKSKTLEQVAFADIVLAAFGTVAAGITGMMDNLKNYDGAAPNAAWKITLAFILLVITAVTSITRWRNPGLFESRAKPWYVAAYLVSFGLALVLAFFGGVILYGF